MNTFEKARTFIYRNARPVDLARWQYHFENGSKDAVLNALAFYQNPDGGFGHAFEADSFNPNSCPIQTQTATVVLCELEPLDPKHPIIQGILSYLASGADFNKEHRMWLNTVPSNNDYPHAVWWSYDGEPTKYSPNPTAALAGFAIKYADRGSELFAFACELAEEAYNWLIEQDISADQHNAMCLLSLYRYCIEAGVELFDTENLLKLVTAQVNASISREPEKWGVEYVSPPSWFIDSKNSPFYSSNEDIVAAECRYLVEKQLPDGSYKVPWQWWTEYKEWQIAENWWKSDIVIKNMRFLKAFTE